MHLVPSDNITVPAYDMDAYGNMVPYGTIVLHKDIPVPLISTIASDSQEASFVLDDGIVIKKVPKHLVKVL